MIDEDARYSKHVIKCGACEMVSNDIWSINQHVDHADHDCIPAKLGRFKEYSKKEMQEIREGRFK